MDAADALIKDYATKNNDVPPRMTTPPPQDMAEALIRDYGTDTREGMRKALVDALTAGQRRADDAEYRQEREQKQAEGDAKRLMQYLPGGSNPVVRNAAVGLGQAGADIWSVGARALGLDAADDLQRLSRRADRMAVEADKDSSLPSWVNRGVRGLSRSIPEMVIGGGAGGAGGAIGGASIIRANQALTEAEDAGIRGIDRLLYAGRAGLVEGVPAAIAQRLGVGGVEAMFGARKAVASGIFNGLRRMGITAIQELPEELITEILDNVNQVYSDVEPGAMDPNSLVQRIGRISCIFE